jgi:hypothetical protein
VGKRSLGRPRHRWEVNIKIYIHEMGCCLDWIDQTQHDMCRAFVNRVMNSRVA